MRACVHRRAGHQNAIKLIPISIKMFAHVCVWEFGEHIKVNILPGCVCGCDLFVFTHESMRAARNACSSECRTTCWTIFESRIEPSCVRTFLAIRTDSRYYSLPVSGSDVFADRDIDRVALHVLSLSLPLSLERVRVIAYSVSAFIRHAGYSCTATG